MDHDRRERMLAHPLFRIVRFTVPWIFVGIVLWQVGQYAMRFQDVRGSAPATPSVSASRTVEATGTAVAGMTGSTIADEVRLRDTGDPGGTVLKELAKGTTFEVMEKRGAWYRVRDASGNIGWLPADPQFVTIGVKK